jgi:hypothetical protein
MLLGSKKESIENLCKDFGIDILYVFGSRFKEVVDFLPKDESASWCRVYTGCCSNNPCKSDSFDI